MAEKNVPETTGASNSKYDEGMIRVLNDVEHVRTRPGMYIGGNNVKGLHHLVYEIVDNSIDEALAGFCKNILVKINADGSRPPSPTTAAEFPWASTRRRKSPRLRSFSPPWAPAANSTTRTARPMPPAAAFTASGHRVVNFLSEWLEVEVSRDGKVYQMEFARGVKASDLKVVGKSTKTGTKVTFKPDKQVFPDVEFKYELLIGRLRELAYLNRGPAYRR